MEEILPLTPGLLISMSVRNDHSFRTEKVWGSFVPDGPRPLEEKQISLIETSWAEYQAYMAGARIQSQRQEELTGKGFYHPDRENLYLSLPTPRALLRAQQLCQARNPIAH